MIRKYVASVYLLLFAFIAADGYGQVKGSFLYVYTDNDSYMLQRKDGYYTNGLRFDYGSYKKDTLTHQLRLQELEIGQLMFNAKNGSYTESWEIDRPVTAYLYATYRYTAFAKQKNILQYAFSIGVIGKPAFGEEVQKFIHTTLDMYTPTEWPFQLSSYWGVTANILYAPDVHMRSSFFRLLPVYQASVGNMFINASLGSALLLGHMNENDNTVFWKTRDRKSKKENYFYFYPTLTLRAYDVTVQGGMFLKNKGPVTGRLNPILFQPKFGWQYANKSLMISCGLTYENKQSLTQLYDQWYGNINFGFLF